MEGSQQLRKVSDPRMGRSGKLQAWESSKLCKQYERVELGAGMVRPVQSSLSHDGISWPLSGIHHRIRQIYTGIGYVKLQPAKLVLRVLIKTPPVS